MSLSTKAQQCLTAAQGSAKSATTTTGMHARKVRGSNPTFASQLLLSSFEQPGSIQALMLPSGGMAARHRKCVTAEQLSFLTKDLPGGFAASPVIEWFKRSLGRTDFNKR
ncbi:hypothetical protein CSKR_110625 [Clonorchis sinensis]|uniref:Uncharacterized protein n=1 Tax=Clonorchis sinensis TaxID=79923 RepID=A0A3R7GRE2_CLOSI|nr:hypothetical protein CSKR_110625 [Clonorchis sinensis]